MPTIFFPESHSSFFVCLFLLEGFCCVEGFSFIWTTIIYEVKFFSLLSKNKLQEMEVECNHSL